MNPCLFLVEGRVVFELVFGVVTPLGLLARNAWSLDPSRQGKGEA